MAAFVSWYPVSGRPLIGCSTVHVRLPHQREEAEQPPPGPVLLFHPSLVHRARKVRGGDGPGRRRISDACLRTGPGNEYLVYVPSGGKVMVDLSDARGTLDVWWFNSSTGIIRNKAQRRAALAQCQLLSITEW